MSSLTRVITVLDKQSLMRMCLLGVVVHTYIHMYVRTYVCMYVCTVDSLFLCTYVLPTVHTTVHTVIAYSCDHSIGIAESHVNSKGA